MTFLTNHDDIAAWAINNILGSIPNIIRSLTIEDGMLNFSCSVKLNGSALTKLPVKFNTIDGTFDVTACSQLESWAGFPTSSRTILATNTSISTVTGIEDNIVHCGRLTMNSLSSGGLSLLLIKDLKSLLIVGHSGGLRADRARNIIYRHLKTKDIFACQQELIDEGLAEWAQI